MYVSWKTSFVYISGHNHYLWGCGGRQRECSICSPSAGGAVGHGQRNTHRCAGGYGLDGARALGGKGTSKAGKLDGGKGHLAQKELI